MNFLNLILIIYVLDVAANTTIDNTKTEPEVKKEIEKEPVNIVGLTREVLDVFTESILQGSLFFYYPFVVDVILSNNLYIYLSIS